MRFCRPMLLSALLTASGVFFGCPSPDPVTDDPDAGVPDAGTQGPDAGHKPDAGERDPDGGMELPSTISLIAGQTGGSGTLDGMGSTARFGGPVQVARHPSGDFYVTDQTGCTIRKVTAAGEVTTFAGVPGICGFADGPLATAQFGSPTGITITDDGTMYVVDSDNTCIRKITPEGQVSIYAGRPGMTGSADGTGIAARFSFDLGTITHDAAGNLYVVDEGSHTIRKIAPGGVVTTYAGMAGEMGFVDGPRADARFAFPFGIVSDDAGNLWITETSVWNMNTFTSPNLIRHVAVNGEVSTLVGDPAGGSGYADGAGVAAQFDGIQGIARDEDGNLYVVEMNNNTIRKITAAGVVSTIAGAAGTATETVDGVGSAARFANPRGITVVPGDSGPQFVVAEYGSSTVRWVDAAKNVTTLAGKPPAFGHADGNAADAVFYEVVSAIPGPNGSIVVADALNNAIRKISADGKVTTWLGVPDEPGNADGASDVARFGNPRGLAFDAEGNLFVADTNNHLIRKVTPAGEVSTYAGGPGPRGGGDFVDGPLLDARFNAPVALAFDAQGRLFVADAANNAIRMIANGAVVTIAGDGYPDLIDGEGSTARFSLPSGIAVDANGHLYIGDSMNAAVRKVVEVDGGWTVSTLAGGELNDDGIPLKGDLDGEGTAARFRDPRGLVVDTAGNVYVADGGNSLVRKISPTGEVTTFAGTRGRSGFLEGEVPGVLPEPAGLAFDANGDLIGTYFSGVFRITLP